MVLLISDEKRPSLCGEKRSKEIKDKGDYKSISDGISDIDNYYERLITEAPYIPGDTKPLIPATDIPWLDHKLLERGIDFGRKNIFSLIICNTAALMFGFSVKPESVVLLRSGKFLQPENAFRRYLSTARRIGSWYMYNILEESSEAMKNIKIVRKLHRYYANLKGRFPTSEEINITTEKIELAKAIRDDLEPLEIHDPPLHLLTWDPPLPFSQFDMAMTQFGFIGLVYLFPKAMGISDMSKVDGFLHYWAVLGRLLGVEDRFNLALHADRKLFLKLYENIGLASLKSTDDTVISLQHALIEGLSKRLPLLTLKGWIYYGLSEENEGFEGKNIWKIMNVKDKICYYSMKGILSLIYKSVVVKLIVNISIAIWLQLSYWIYLPKDTGCPF